MNNWKSFFLSLIIFFSAFQACSTKKNKKLLTIQELLAFQKKTQAEITKPDSVKIWGDEKIKPVLVKKTTTIFSDDFTNLDHWHHEGIGHLSQPDSNVLQITCVGSTQGNVGSMAFCKQDFPDSIVVDYDLYVLETRGLLINFIACQGRHGEDILKDLPKRRGTFADYVYNPNMRSYHVSISRYDDSGKHTGVSNWRRNPGLFLMAQQADLCKTPREWYHIRILKLKNILQMWVNGQYAGGFKDRNEIPEPLPSSGKIGFRTIGEDVVVQIKNFRVSKIDRQSIAE